MTTKLNNDKKEKGTFKNTDASMKKKSQLKLLTEKFIKSIDVDQLNA